VIFVTTIPHCRADVRPARGDVPGKIVEPHRAPAVQYPQILHQALLGSMPKLGSKRSCSRSRPPPDLATLRRAARSTRAAPRRCRAAPARPARASGRELGRAAAGQPQHRRSKGGRCRAAGVDGLVKHFPVAVAFFPRRRIAWVKAVDGIDFAIDAGRRSRIGESGCGKHDSKMILLQEAPTAGDPLRWRHHRSGAALMRYRASTGRVPGPVQLAVRRHAVGEIIAEPRNPHDLSREQRERVADTGLVGLRRGARLFPPIQRGQRQRVAIAAPSSPTHG